MRIGIIVIVHSANVMFGGYPRPRSANPTPVREQDYDEGASSAR